MACAHAAQANVFCYTVIQAKKALKISAIMPAMPNVKRNCRSLDDICKTTIPNESATSPGPLKYAAPAGEKSPIVRHRASE